MKKIIILLLLAAIPAKSYAWFDKPTVEDYILQTGFIGLMIADWKQTNWISDNPEVFKEYKYIDGLKYEHYTYHEESNPILGKHPSKKKIAIYFSSCIVGHTAITFVLPKYYRNLFQAIGIGVEIHATTNNYNCGVKIKF